MPEHYYLKPEAKFTAVRRIEHAEAFFAATHADIRYRGGRAYYAQDADYIQMPPIESFRDAESFYATLAGSRRALGFLWGILEESIASCPMSHQTLDELLKVSIPSMEDTQTLFQAILGDRRYYLIHGLNREQVGLYWDDFETAVQMLQLPSEKWDVLFLVHLMGRGVKVTRFENVWH